MVDVSSARKYLLEFAKYHNISFVEDGEIGFNNKVVGLKHGEFFIEFNPVSTSDNKVIEKYYFPEIYKHAPHFRYFAHDCIAVRIIEENVDAAIIGLAEWLINIEKVYEITIIDYPTGHIGNFSKLIGEFNKCIKLEAKK